MLAKVCYNIVLVFENVKFTAMGGNKQSYAKTKR